MALVEVTPPAAPAVLLEDVKLYLRLDHDAEDLLLESLVEAATEYAETALGQQLVNATWRYELDCFPETIRLPLPPLSSVTSIIYDDVDGTAQTLAAAMYTVDADSRPARIVPAYGEVWPVTYDHLAAVRILFIAGYGVSAAFVPDNIQTAIKMLAAHWYQHREPTISGTIIAQVPLAVEALLNMSWHGEYV